LLFAAGGGEGSSSDADDEDSEGGEGGGGGDAGDIADETGTDVVNLRRTIYLTIMSSLDFEEAGHKLMKITLRPGQVGLCVCVAWVEVEQGVRMGRGEGGRAGYHAVCVVMCVEHMKHIKQLA
jgi:hypothetical protein